MTKIGSIHLSKPPWHEVKLLGSLKGNSSRCPRKTLNSPNITKKVASCVLKASARTPPRYKVKLSSSTSSSMSKLEERPSQVIPLKALKWNGFMVGTARLKPVSNAVVLKSKRMSMISVFPAHWQDSVLYASHVASIKAPNRSSVNTSCLFEKGKLVNKVVQWRQDLTLGSKTSSKVKEITCLHSSSPCQSCELSHVYMKLPLDEELFTL